MFNRVIVGHVKGIVAAHYDLVRAIEFDQIFQLVIGEDNTVDPDLLEVVCWRLWQVGLAVFARAPSVINPA
jgi:hypothetical protein